VQLDEFIDFLNLSGVEFYTTDRSIVLKEAPCCGEHDKVWLLKDSNKGGAGAFYGKCMKCDTEWSSRDYLIESGIEQSTVEALHGIKNFEGFQLSTLPALDIGVKSKEYRPPAEEQEAPKDFNISAFFKVSDFPDHEAARYAVGRGWVPAWEDAVMVDIMANAAVFICREGANVVGYQKRFLHPSDPKKKTKSVSGFRKTQHVILFPGAGDLMVCEGPFNALSAWHYGYFGVCTFGASVSERQIELITEIAQREGKSVGIAFDLDSAGKKGYRRLRLSLFWRKIQAYRVKPEVGNDLNESWQKGKGIVVTPPGEDDITVPDLDIEDIVTGRQ
jgi:hypothetical protein